MLTRNDLNISTEALLLLVFGVSGTGVSRRRGGGPPAPFSRELYIVWSLSFKVVRLEGVVVSPRYEREASVAPLK